MKMLLISAAATALLVGTALASPNDDQQDHHKQAMQDNDHKTDQKDTTSKADAKSDGTRNVTVNRDVNVNKDVTVNRDVNVNRNVTVNRDVDVNRNVTVGRQFDSHHRNFDIAVFQGNVRAERHFHVGFYRAPVGYHYRRWVYGQRLPSSYFVRDYWLTDYVTFGLMAPPSGFVWVRFGPDAVLIDQFTGEIVQVQYGIFI